MTIRRLAELVVTEWNESSFPGKYVPNSKEWCAAVERLERHYWDVSTADDGSVYVPVFVEDNFCDWLAKQLQA